MFPFRDVIMRQQNKWNKVRCVWCKEEWILQIPEIKYNDQIQPNPHGSIVVAQLIDLRRYYHFNS